MLNRCRKPATGLNAQSAQRGFTIVAMAAILMVAAMTISLLLPDEGAINAERIRVTQERMNRIHHAMETYILAKGNLLPCPARLDRSYTAGQFQQSITECDRAGRACESVNGEFRFNGLICQVGSNIVAGAVPVAQLNLADKDMIDGWGNKIYYVVDTTVTRAATMPAGYSPMIQVYGIDSTDPKTMDGKQLINAPAQKAYGVLFSTGPNANGAFGGNGVRRTCNVANYDGQNCDFDSDMLQYTADRFRREDGEFDDIVLPIILESRSCKEPVPCWIQHCNQQTSNGTCTVANAAGQQVVPVDGGPLDTASMTPAQLANYQNRANQPEGCVHRAIAPAGAWPIGPGNNTSGSFRTRASGGSDLICCDGQWKLGGC